MTHPRAGQPAEPADLVDVPRLVTAYYAEHPDPADPAQQVSFGTSGHRGSSLRNAFNSDHILAVTQALCDYRREQGLDGPLFLARDTHALSAPAAVDALEVLAANGVTVLVDSRDGYTPTPALSHAILTHNRGRTSGLADGIVITPSHNPPDDGGFKYNPTNGGPADTDVTRWIQDRANAILAAGLKEVRRITYARARAADTTGEYDFLAHYVDDLPAAIDIDAIRDAGIRIGADPLGGASVAYWGEIAERHRLDLTVVNPTVDPTWRFMTLDGDGKIRMDCSSPNAMASLIAARADYQISTGNDADADRHGIVTPDAGLMNPNHYLAVAIGHLFRTRTEWGPAAAVGKTLVSSSMIDRVAADLGRPLLEVPVGFKWFVPGLLDGAVGFGGEESAGASFLRRDGSHLDHRQGRPAALPARLRDPGHHRAAARASTGRSWPSGSARPRTPGSTPRPPGSRRPCSASSRPEQVTATELAGEPITATLTTAPGNNAPIGGLKVSTESGWFAARPSGTEDVYKIYAESFQGPDHLKKIQEEAKALVDQALTA